SSYSSRFGIAGSPGIAWPSLAHSPKSINLQRSLQKGRTGKSSVQVIRFLQVGQSSSSGAESLLIINQKSGKFKSKKNDIYFSASFAGPLRGRAFQDSP